MLNLPVIKKKINSKHDGNWFLSCSLQILFYLFKLCSVNRALAEVCNLLPLQNEMKLLNYILCSDLVTNVGGQYRPVVA